MSEQHDHLVLEIELGIFIALFLAFIISDFFENNESSPNPSPNTNTITITGTKDVKNKVW